MKKLAYMLSITVLLASLHLGAHAAIIYDNSQNDLNQRLSAPSGVWIGDQVTLAGTERWLTSFGFQYWAENTTGLTLDVRLLLNDGPESSGYATPNTVLFSYNNVSLDDTTRNVLEFNSTDWPLGLNIPANELTLAIRFNYTQGLAGVDLYGPVAIGSSYADYWLDTGAGWQLVKSTAFEQVNFAMDIQAVPEPTTIIAALGVGLLGLLTVARRRLSGSNN